MAPPTKLEKFARLKAWQAAEQQRIKSNRKEWSDLDWNLAWMTYERLVENPQDLEQAS